MAVDNSKLLYLLDPAFQIENIAGKPAVGGHIEVFYAGTDVKVITKQNFDGVDNPFKVPLNNDGRAVMLVSPGAKYDIYFYDSFNNLMFSRLNVFAQGEGEGSVSGLTQIFHDDTLTGDGSYHDPLGAIEYTGILPIDVNNDLHLISAQTTRLGVELPLYFVRDDDEMTVIGYSGTPLLPSGTMNESAFGYENGQITGYNGSAFSAGNTYEAGSYISIVNNTISVSGLTPVPADTASTGLVASVSADITAMIPDTSDMATKTWVDEQGFLTAHQDISNKLDTTAFSTISGDFITAIPSEYVTENTLQSGLSSKLDSTAFSTVSSNFLTAVPEGYATTAQLQTVSGEITAMIPTALTGDYLTKESADTLYYPLESNPNGYLTAETDWTNTITAASANAYAEATAAIPTGLATTADLQTVSGEITAMIPSTAGLATEDWVTGQGYITGVDLSPYQTTAGMTAYQEVLEFSYDSANYISAINNSGITRTPSRDLYVREPLYTGMSGTSAYLGVYESAIQPLVFGYTAIGE